MRAFRLHYTAQDLMLLHKKAIYLCKIQIYYNRFSMKECLNGFKSKEFSKGQLISKGIFGILNSPKKQTKKFKFTTMIPVAVKFFQNCSNKTKQNDTRV